MTTIAATTIAAPRPFQTAGLGRSLFAGLASLIAGLQAALAEDRLRGEVAALSPHLKDDIGLDGADFV